MVRKLRTICSIQKTDVLSFQVLLSFVSTVFHFSQCPAVASCRDHSAFTWTSVRPGARLRQSVSNKTTMIGYHRPKDLSSEKSHSLLELSRRAGVAQRRESREGVGEAKTSAGAGGWCRLQFCDSLGPNARKPQSFAGREFDS